MTGYQMLLAVCLLVVIVILIALLWLSHKKEQESSLSVLGLLVQMNQNQEATIREQRNLLLSQDPLVFAHLQATSQPTSQLPSDYIDMSDEAEARRYSEMTGIGEPLYDDPDLLPDFGGVGPISTD